MGDRQQVKHQRFQGMALVLQRLEFALADFRHSKLSVVGLTAPTVEVPAGASRRMRASAGAAALKRRPLIRTTPLAARLTGPAERPAAVAVAGSPRGGGMTFSAAGARP